MTGITDKSEFNGLEIDWTCTHPNHRHKGYMQKLFTKMLNGIDRTKSIYCSCWRIQNKDRVNLQTIMSLFDFREVIHTRVHWKVQHNCFRDYTGGCVCFTGNDCECYEDLYLRKYN